MRGVEQRQNFRKGLQMVRDEFFSGEKPLDGSCSAFTHAGFAMAGARQVRLLAEFVPEIGVEFRAERRRWTYR